MDYVFVPDEPNSGQELLSLKRMAARMGVPAAWLRERAEAGEIPGLHAGSRWLFRPDVVFPAVAEMATGSSRSKGGDGDE